ncbi:MAG: protein kinase, partial [Myxococcota bacterium]
PKFERFEIVDTLGEGGMGVVYLADQLAPVERRVALKVLSTEVKTKEAEIRFKAEQKTLARLNHPNIAQLFDAGTTEGGLPYFAMELVEGTNLVDFANGRSLTVHDRLHLFFQTCAAVQFAHQKGILHRDLKPSNILVQESNAGPQVKLIDFGIAKALVQTHDDPSLTGPLGLGTPAYMAPEAFSSDADLDTRSDVFSLCVVLQQLMLGSVPYGKGSAMDIVQQIASRSVADPVTQWHTLDDRTKTVILNERNLSPAGMQEILKGDLGAIVAKGTAMDPADRYGTVSELAQDLRAYLDGYPVIARRMGTAYRLGKFVKRHRVAVAMTGALTLSVIFGGGIALYEARIANLESQRATEAAERASEEAERANREARTAAEVTEFLVGLFRLANPDETVGKKISAKEILDRGVENLEAELADQPELMARMGLAIAETYLGLGLFEQAGSLLDRSLAWAEESTGKSSELTGHVLTAIGRQSMYAHTVDKGVDALERADAIFELALGRGSIPWAISHAWLGFAASYRGDDQGAAPMLSEAVAVLADADAAPVSDRIFALSKHGISMSVIGEYDDARQSLQRAKALADSEPGGDGYMNLVLNGLTLHYSHAENYERALELAIQTYEKNVADHGAEHPDILNSWSLYIIFLLKTERDEEALAEATRFLEVASRLERTVDQAYAMRHLARAHLALGDVEKAWAIINDAERRVVEKLGEEHGITRYVRVTWAEVASAKGQHDAALAIARPLLERSQNKYGAKSRITRDVVKMIERFERRQSASARK